MVMIIHGLDIIVFGKKEKKIFTATLALVIIRILFIRFAESDLLGLLNCYFDYYFPYHGT